MANEYKRIIKEKMTDAKKLMTADQIVKCNVVIHTATTAASAEAFVPIPGADAVPITATQVTMIVALGKIFDQKISEGVAKGIIGATASTIIGRNLVKLIPVAGWAVSVTVAAGVTEAIGWTVAVDFANRALKEKNEYQNVIDCPSEDLADNRLTTDGTTSDGVDEDNLDDESICNEVSKLFEEDDE